MRIARELGVHPDTVRNAIEAERFRSTQPLRPSIADPYAEFIRQTMDQHPRLRATRIYQMLRDRACYLLERASEEIYTVLEGRRRVIGALPGIKSFTRSPENPHPDATVGRFESNY